MGSLENGRPSPSLRAYASALVQPGWRQEVQGGPDNVAKAIRCYTKAARLGHVQARERLEARSIQ